MRRLFRYLEKFFPLLKNTYLPAVIFTVGLLGFYLYQPLDEARLHSFHNIYLALSLLCLLLLFYFNHSKPFFFILVSVVAYILLNFLKQKYGEEYILTPEYANLSILLPPILLLLYYLPDTRLRCDKQLYIFLALWGVYAVGERLAANGITLGSALGSLAYAVLNNLSLLLIGIGAAALFITGSLSGRLYDIALFFAYAEICLGLYYSPSASALTIFFGCSSLTFFSSLCEHLYNITYHDSLTGLYSRKSFLNHTKTFPLKYSIALVLIDDYERLSKVFGQRGLNALIKMISLRIVKTEPETQIYRYSPEEFVILFRGETKNSAFERTENIRRSVASAEFILKGFQKPLKLTVSAAISEKKRSDANAVEVLSRAGKALQKAGRFTQNITTKA